MNHSPKQHVCDCDEPCLSLDGSGGFTCLRCGKPAARVPEPVTEDRTQDVARRQFWVDLAGRSDLDYEDLLE